MHLVQTKIQTLRETNVTDYLVEIITIIDNDENNDFMGYPRYLLLICFVVKIS